RSTCSTSGRISCRSIDRSRSISTRRFRAARRGRTASRSSDGPDRQETDMAVRLGDEAPEFAAHTTGGAIEFPPWKGGDWAVLFSHRRDFRPVCTTELGALAALKAQFDQRHTKVIGLSVDPVGEHHKWKGDIKDVTGHGLNFPLIADPDRKVASLYDMIHPN